MTLNSKQLTIVIVSVMLFVMMGIYPPWINTFDAQSIHSENPTGYTLIMSPPKPEKDSRAFGVRLDISRLLVQWITLIMATACAVLLAKGSCKKMIRNK